MYKSMLERSVEKNLDYIAENMYGEFGFDTLHFEEKIELLKKYRNNLFNEIETLKDHDRLLQAIGAQKELNVVDKKIEDLNQF